VDGSVELTDALQLSGMMMSCERMLGQCTLLLVCEELLCVRLVVGYWCACCFSVALATGCSSVALAACQTVCANPGL
jgi:hypothetical protein